MISVMCHNTILNTRKEVSNVMYCWQSQHGLQSHACAVKLPQQGLCETLLRKCSQGLQTDLHSENRAANTSPASHQPALGTRPLVRRDFATQSGQTALRNGKDYFQLLLDTPDDAYKMQMLLIMSQCTANCNIVEPLLRIYYSTSVLLNILHACYDITVNVKRS